MNSFRNTKWHKPKSWSWAFWHRYVNKPQPKEPDDDIPF